MADVPYMPVFCEPLLADTDHLSDAEMGLYTRMLVKLWLAPRQRFPNDLAWLARKFRKTPDEAGVTILPLVEEFFQRDGNWITHKRLSREFERVFAQLQKQSDRAKSRWNKDKGSSRGNAGPAVPSTSRSTLRKEEEKDSIPPPPESLPPRDPEDGSSEPGQGEEGKQEIIFSARVSAETIDGLMPYYETMNSRRGVERLVDLLVEQVGSAPMVEGRLLEAIMTRKQGPIQYVRKILDGHIIERLERLQTAKHRELNGKPDPVMEGDRMTREILASMGTSNDDDAASHPGLTH